MALKMMLEHYDRTKERQGTEAADSAFKSKTTHHVNRHEAYSKLQLQALHGNFITETRYAPELSSPPYQHNGRLLLCLIHKQYLA